MNIISVSASDELYLTFTFTMHAPSVVEGTPEANSRVDAIRAGTRNVVQRTIDMIRQLVIEGKL